MQKKSFLSLDNLYSYFKYILFDPKIVLKFSLEQQNKIWYFFEEIKSIYKKKSKLDNNPTNYIFNHSYYRKYFLSFEQLNNFILLFNKKYPNEFLSPHLLNIIKNIFFDSATSDYERESLLLLINSYNQNQYRLSDKIIISILEIFIYYLDTNYKKYMANNTKLTDILKIDNINNTDSFFYSPKMSVKSFLSSPNYFIETLLGILSTNNINIKKVLINLLRIISQKYSESLKNHFIDIETDIRKSKKLKTIKRVSKEEFFFFIEENISPNNNNQKLREMREFEIYNKYNDKNNSKVNIKTNRRKSTMDDINIINNNIENTNYKNKSSKKSKKDNNKKSKSCENKDISEIKTKINQNNNDNSLYPRRKTDFNFFNIRYNSLSNLNNINLKNISTRISAGKTEPINEVKENENEINENIIKKKFDNEQLEIQKTNCEITMILFDWLITSDKKELDKRLSSGNLSSLSNIAFDTNNNSNLSDTIINFILKLLNSNKDLEVLYKFLFIIIGQKGFNFGDKKKNLKNNLMSINDNYLKLLNYFSASKTKFLQFLEELMINSYLCLYCKEGQNKFNFIDETNIHQKDKNEYFKIIYEKVKELIIDIYFNEGNLYKNDIIYEVINIILFLYGGFNNKEDINEENIKIKNILINMLTEFLNEIIEIYNIKIDIYKSKLRKKSSKDFNNNKNNDSLNEKNEKVYSNYEAIKKNYSIFFTFIFEYTLLMTNSNNFISNKFSKEFTIIKNFSGIPDFLKYEIDIKDNKILINSKIELFLKAYNTIIKNFNIQHLLKKINNSLQEKKDSKDFKENKEKEKDKNNIENKNIIEENEGDIFNFEPNKITKLFKEFSINKELKNKLKEKLNLLFLNYKEDFNNFPLITIITILSNYYIDFYINSKSQKEKDLKSKEYLDFISFLNLHMQFILIIILVSSSIKENENYPLKQKTYKDIQEIIFSNLLYNMNNLVFYFDSPFSPTFIEIFTNIITLISYIWFNDNDHKSLFHLGKNKSRNAVKRILNYYITKYSSFFKNSNLEIISKQSIKKNKEMFMLETNNIYNYILRNTNEDKPENLPSEDIFDISKYEHIYKTRKYDLNRKLKLLINDNSDQNNFDNNDEESK